MRARRGTLITRLAPLALMPAGAFAVHQLRYWLAYGRQAGAELERQGHSYLHSLVPWIVLLLAVAVGAFVRAVGRALRGQSSLPRYTVSLAGLWILCATCLLCIYTVQEFLEGVFATGHPAALVGIFGYGGWWAVPASLVVGLLLAALLHGVRAVLAEIVRRSRFVASPSTPRAVRSPRAVWFPRPTGLASGWSGRGPPV